MKNFLICSFVLLTLAACGKSDESIDPNRFPGFTQTGREGDAAKFFVDLNSVIRDRSGTVSFNMVRVIYGGGYVIQNAQTDCRNVFQGNEGVKYKDDGTSESKFPADKINIDTQTQPGISALLKLVCDKAEENRMIIGAFDDIKALEILYGPYQPEAKAALWSDMQVPHQIDTNEIFSETDGLVSVIASNEFTQTGVTKQILLTSTQPNGDSNQCHGCAPLINAAIFVKVGEKWRVEAHYPYLAFMGAYGAPPSMSWTQIGADKYAIVVQSGDMHMGFYWEGISINELGNNGLTPLLQMGISDSFEEGDSYSLHIAFDPAPATGYSTFKISVKHEITGQTDDVTTLNYTFKDGKYITKDHIPGEEPISVPTPITNTTTVAPVSTPAAVTDKPVVAPKIRIGDSYTFEAENVSNSKLSYVATREVTAIEDNRLTMVTTNAKSGSERTTYYDRTWGYLGSGSSDNNGVSFSPALKYLDFPLSPGKKWTAQSTETDKKTGHQRQHTIIGMVEGWEKVQVPAGEFEALKIVLKTEVKDGDKVSPGSDVSWYVPALRRSVKSELSGLDVSTGIVEKKIIRLLSYHVPTMSIDL